MERKEAKEMNQERQASLKKDTDKLLQIATELKQQVDKTNENQLSLAVIRKTEEVEKLAKSSRDKMKSGGYCDLMGQSPGQDRDRQQKILTSKKSSIFFTSYFSDNMQSKVALLS